MERNNIVTLIKNVCIARKLCKHLIGESHTIVHRLSVGFVILITGVCISKIHTELFVLHIITDGIGYTIHAIGSIPFVELILNKNET